MADERKIVIELTANGSNGVHQKEDNQESDAGKDLKKFLKVAQHPIKALEDATLGKNVLAHYTLRQAWNLTKNSAMFYIGRGFNLSENYKGEQDLQNTINVLNQFTNGAQTIIGGAMMGGPVGAIIGAGVWIGGQVLNAIKKYDAQERMLVTMNIQSSFQQTRLGLIDNGRGTQN